MNCHLTALDHRCGVAEDRLDLDFLSRENSSADILIDQWNNLAHSDADKAFIYEIWIDWARNRMTTDIEPLEARCTALYWGGSVLSGCRAKVFAQSALRLRTASPAKAWRLNVPFSSSPTPMITRLYPPSAEYRFWRLRNRRSTPILWTWRATFAPGSAERLSNPDVLWPKMLRRSGPE